MADYINTNIVSQAYVHIEPTAFNTPEDLERFKSNLEAFAKSRVGFFLSPDLPIEIVFEEGSLIARVTVLGTIGLLLHGISCYKDFREGIQLIYSDAKRVTEYIISHTSFEAGSRQQNVIRLEARVGIIGSIQKCIKQLESIKRGANGALLAEDVSKKATNAISEIRKLMDNINDQSDKELVKNGLLEIVKELPNNPKPPKDKVNSQEAILGYQRKKNQLLATLNAVAVHK